MIKAVILDLNGVFIESPKLSDRFEKDFKISSEVFLPKLFETMDKIRLPNALPAFTYWQPILESWNIKMNEQEFWSYWFGREEPVEEMIELSRKIKKSGVKVFILSNNFKERAEYYGHYPWLYEVVDKVYFSWQTGFVKPDERAWQLVLKENNLQPEEVLYCDDQERNNKVARGLNIQTHSYVGVDELEKFLKEQGLGL